MTTLIITEFRLVSNYVVSYRQTFSFGDVSEKDWSYEAIKFVYENGVIRTREIGTERL